MQSLPNWKFPRTDFCRLRAAYRSSFPQLCDYGISLPSVCCFKTFFDFFSKKSWQGFISMVNFFVKVHRQTRRKSATQSYRDPPGQPVASKKLLFCCRQQICGFSRNRSWQRWIPSDTLTAEQSTYNVLLFSAVRKYRFMKSDDAFSHGFAMPWKRLFIFQRQSYKNGGDMLWMLQSKPELAGVWQF